MTVPRVIAPIVHRHTAIYPAATRLVNMVDIDLLDEPRAIDTHAHQPTAEFLHDAGGEMMRDAAGKFGTELETWGYEEMREEYHAAGIRHAVLLGWDAETNTGNPPVENDYVAAVRDDYR
jgi:hypothetical protein